MKTRNKISLYGSLEQLEGIEGSVEEVSEQNVQILANDIEIFRTTGGPIDLDWLYDKSGKLERERSKLVGVVIDLGILLDPSIDFTNLGSLHQLNYIAKCYKKKEGANES